MLFIFVFALIFITKIFLVEKKNASLVFDIVAKGFLNVLSLIYIVKYYFYIKNCIGESSFYVFLVSVLVLPMLALNNVFLVLDILKMKQKAPSHKKE